MTNREDKKPPLRPVLRTMEVGQAVVFPLERASAVYSVIYSVSVQYDRKFTTRTDREARTLAVTRIK